MGLLDRIRGEDEGEEEGDSLADAADGSDGDLGMGGGGGGGLEDDFDMGGGGSGDDLDLGDGGNEFGGDEELGGGDTSVRDLENRVEEVESELSSISSTVGTVRSENEQISESVEEVEEHVRQLLDIYEMVTRGVNPFVDEASADSALGGGADGDGLGLFDTDEDDAEGDDVDSSVADADAESFFDEDALDEEDEVDDDFEDDDLFGDEDGELEAEGGELDDDPLAEEGDDMTTADDGGGAKSFDELKAEYEAGADWAEDEEAPDAAEEGGESLGDDLDAGGDDLEAEASGGDDLDQLFDEHDEEAAEQAAGGAGGMNASGANDAGGAPAAPDPSAAAGADGGSAGPTAPGMAEKPYLKSVPAGYVGDLVVLEWLEFLVDRSNAEDAARALAYYETVDWIAPEAADHLRDFLTGFGDFDPDGEAPAPRSLTMDDHITSLRFIGQLSGSATDATTISRWTGAGDDDPAVAASNAAADTAASLSRAGGENGNSASEPQLEATGGETPREDLHAPVSADDGATANDGDAGESAGTGIPNDPSPAADDGFADGPVDGAAAADEGPDPSDLADPGITPKTDQPGGREGGPVAAADGSEPNESPNADSAMAAANGSESTAVTDGSDDEFDGLTEGNDGI